MLDEEEGGLGACDRCGLPVCAGADCQDLLAHAEAECAVILTSCGGGVQNARRKTMELLGDLGITH